ncbi:MAG: hypothetical protein ACK4FJ_16190 [Ferrovibrio sp.]|uniref:hypothetical protein n=1 Tax=Ferrovibrio sp. TaxID=1917215 RepID=UPI00391B9CA9
MMALPVCMSGMHAIVWCARRDFRAGLRVSEASQNRANRLKQDANRMIRAAKTAAERTKAADSVKTDSKPTQNTRFDINDISDITLAGPGGGR